MKKNTKKIISIAVASKLATTLNTASAEGLGKLQTDNTSSTSLSLDQIGYPLQILTPPTATANDNGGKNATGTIFTADSGKSVNSGLQPRIDFVINHIQSKDKPVVVFIAYSTTQGSPSQWADVPLNNLFLDRDTLHIISAFQVDPIKSFDTFNVIPSPLGTVDNEKGNSMIVSLNLADLEHSEFNGNKIYFQAVAIPLVNGQFIYAEATTSELDHYTISRAIPNQEGSGSKLTDSNSIVANTISAGTSKVNDTVSKVDSNTGGKNTNGDDTGGK